MSMELSEVAGSGLVDEHGPRQKEDKEPKNYQPTDDEKKAIKLVERLFDKAKKHRALYDENWLEYYRFFRGKQWKEQRPSYRHSEVINFVFRTIQSIIPIELDARPKFGFMPEEPSDLELAEILNEAAEAEWAAKNWSMELLEVICDKNVYGTGISCMELEDVKNDIDYHSSDPFYFYPDPDATDINKKSWYCVYAEPITVEKIKKNPKWKDKKDFIKPDLLDLMKGQKNESGQVMVRSPIDSKVIIEGSSPLDIAQKDKSLLITCYIAPEMLVDEFDEHEQPIMETATIFDEATQQEVQVERQVGVEYIQVAKYPNGRKIVICNNVLLEDKPNPYDDGEFPYQRNINYALPREFWGSGEVEQIMGPQKIFNKVFSFALDVLTIMGNPIWKVPTTSGIDPENLVNRPGLVVEYDGDAPPTREEGVQLQPYVLQIADKVAEWIDSIAGAQDITRGVQPTGVTAASAISQLQEAAQTRIRQKVRNTGAYLKDVGRHWLSRTLQFRTAPQMYRLTNKDGANKYFRMYVEPFEYMGEDGKSTGEQWKRIKIQNYTNDGKINPAMDKTFETRAKFDVRVAADSEMPFNKDAKEQRLLNFFDRGLIDRQEVLKQADYPNWQVVDERLAQKDAAAAQAKAQPA